MIEIEPGTDHGLARLVIEAVKGGCDSLRQLAELLVGRISPMLVIECGAGRLVIRHVGSTLPADRILVVREVEQ